jgi:hypothetical protein
MCTTNEQIVLGADPSNSLNQVWKGQTEGCDNLLTAVCAKNDLAKTRWAEMCSCFTQQRRLDGKYGINAEVPACCFGTDLSGDIKKSCSFNDKAYKTAKMMRNCCSLAECQHIVKNVNTFSGDSHVVCDGQIVQLPTPKTTDLSSCPLPRRPCLSQIGCRRQSPSSESPFPCTGGTCCGQAWCC